MSDLENQRGCLSGILPASIIAFLRRVLGESSSTAASYEAEKPALPKVMVNKFFVSNAECAFMHSLRRVVGDRAHILAQVSLQQLLYFPFAREDQKSVRTYWRNKVRARSVDFLLCCPRTMKPLVAIEYDDRSHEQEDRKTRDVEVERLFDAAGLPLVRIQCGKGDDVKSLQAALSPYLKS